MIFSKAFYLKNDKSQEVKIEFISSAGVFWISLGDDGQCSEIPVEDIRQIMNEIERR